MNLRVKGRPERGRFHTCKFIGKAILLAREAPRKVRDLRRRSGRVIGRWGYRGAAHPLKVKPHRPHCVALAEQHSKCGRFESTNAKARSPARAQHLGFLPAPTGQDDEQLGPECRWCWTRRNRRTLASTIVD